MRRGAGLVGVAKPEQARGVPLPDSNSAAEARHLLRAPQVKGSLQNKALMCSSAESSRPTAALQRQHRGRGSRTMGQSGRPSLAKNQAGRQGRGRSHRFSPNCPFDSLSPGNLRCLITPSCAHRRALEALAGIQHLNKWNGASVSEQRPFWTQSGMRDLSLPSLFLSLPTLPQIFIKPLLCTNHLEIV